MRALDIWRTPTVLVIDAAGVIRSRASGPTNRAHLLAAVADVVTPVTVRPATAPPEKVAA